jgi:antitoxin ParD1/3/4
MSRNTSITLSEHFARFVDDEIASGRFASASEVVRAGLRLLEEREMKVKALREALIEGEKSGPLQPFDFDDLIARKHQALTD